jgi:hypothetical protein
LRLEHMAHSSRAPPERESPDPPSHPHSAPVLPPNVLTMGPRVAAPFSTALPAA